MRDLLLLTLLVVVSTHAATNTTAAPTVAAQTVAAPTCVFPFTYKNKTHEACTSEDSVYPWCATTAEYQKGKWIYCPEGTATEAPEVVTTEAPPTCAFPFTYKNKTYTTCTSDDSFYSWCATTSEYQSGKWIYCPQGDETEEVTEAPVYPEEACVFPFNYNGKSYDKCVSGTGGYWCSTTADYDGDYVYCRDPTYTTDGMQCALPFEYSGTVYYTCTTKNNYGTPWCSLTYKYDGSYGNCAE